MQKRTRLILIEGLPGSGKTSLAEWLCARLRVEGSHAVWIPELQRDHPAIDRPTMRTARQRGYAERCIARWEAFSTRAQVSEAPEVFILEGCFFQSTVRFLIEYERSDDEIDSYLPAVERCLAPLSPCLVYLTQPDAVLYLQQELIRRKGEEIVSRIAAYSSTTPYAVTRSLQGMSALVSLYAAYRGTCDRLVRRSRMPVLEMDAVRCSEAAVRDQVAPWVSAAIRC